MIRWLLFMILADILCVLNVIPTSINNLTDAIDFDDIYFSLNAAPAIKNYTTEEVMVSFRSNFHSC
jgi:hypothetical protein